MDRETWEEYADYVQRSAVRRGLDVALFLLAFSGLILGSLAVSVIMRPIEEGFLAPNGACVQIWAESAVLDEEDACRRAAALHDMETWLGENARNGVLSEGKVLAAAARCFESRGVEVHHLDVRLAVPGESVQ
jgi:hypothetical protein